MEVSKDDDALKDMDAAARVLKESVTRVKSDGELGPESRLSSSLWAELLD